MKLIWQPQHFNIGGSMSMNDVKSLSRSKWRCKYHIVLVVSIILCKRLFILNYQTYFVTD